MSARRRWVYTQGGQSLPEPIEVSDEWSDVPKRTGDGLKFEFDNMRATDGADISSYTKHKRYMKERGLALLGDFKETGEKARRGRERCFSPQHQSRERRETMGRALHQMRQRRR